MDLTTKADGTACTGVTIERIAHSITGFTQVQLLWDATTDTIAISLAEASNGHMDFSDFGGLVNTSGSGKNWGYKLNHFRSRRERYLCDCFKFIEALLIWRLQGLETLV